MAQHRGQDRRHLVAERHRNRLLQVAAPDDRRVAVALGESRERTRDRLQLGVDDREPLADLQHGRGVGDVLRGGAPVAVFAELVAAQRVQLRDDTQDRIADALRLRAELLHVDLADVAVADDFVGGLLRNDAEPALHDGERPLDVDVLLRAILVGPDAAHRLAAEEVAEDA